MKREEIKSIFADATDEQLKAILDINGADIEKAKGKLSEVEAELKSKKEAFESLTNEFEELKNSKATADDWEKKFNDLQTEIKDKEAKAEADRIAKEKADGINNRFSAVLGDKKFNHEAIKNDYLKKFGDAIENKEFEGKSDTEIFHELTKDDTNAFQGVVVTNLSGAVNNDPKDIDEDKIRSIMGLPKK